MTTTTGDSWSIETDNGSTLSGSSGNSVTLTAGSAAGSATVYLTGPPRLCTQNELTFQIIAPSDVVFVKTNTRHIHGYADVGTIANVYLGPDTVSFENVWWDEALAYASGNGVWLCENGQPHEENQDALKVGSTVVPGYGSQLAGGAQDLEDSGACSGNQLLGGSESVIIPEQWQTYGSGWNFIQSATQSGSADTSGTATLTKDAQATETAHLNDPNEGGETPPP